MHGPLALFKGWTVICAAERTREAVMDALRKGEFYATQGPEFHKFALEGDTLSVEFSDAAECCFIAKKGRRYIAARDPEELKKGAGIVNGAKLDLSGMRTGDNFVRCHICDVQGRHAWSNPIYL